jgi:hypothetical protein
MQWLQGHDIHIKRKFSSHDLSFPTWEYTEQQDNNTYIKDDPG